MEYLLYVSNGLIILSFALYILLILLNSKKKFINDGFSITKDILDEFDAINIIENTGMFTVYNIQRKVIKIASRRYYGKSISDASIPLIEAGISVVDNKRNKFINFFRKIIPNLKLLYIFPFIAIGINSITYGTSDAKIGILVLALCVFISYVMIDIKSAAKYWLNKNVSKISYVDKNGINSINNFIDRVILFDKLIFIGELLMIIRFVYIIL